jgi:hypothetical protein
MRNAKLVKKAMVVLLIAIIITVYGGQCGNVDNGTSGSSAPLQKPSVTTNPAVDITHDSAVLNGTINPHGINTKTYFMWGENILNTPVGYQNVGSGMASVSVSSQLTGLKSNTIYGFKLNATNTLGTFSGSKQLFTTLKPPPNCATNSASNVTFDSATLNGQVNPKGLDTNVHFEYGLTVSYAERTSSQAIGDGFSSIAIAANITGLLSSKKYNFMIVGTNSSGMSHGNNLVFTTGAPIGSAPTCTTDSVCNITISSVRLNGTINPNSSATMYYFEHGISSTPVTYPVKTTSQSSGSGIISVAVNADINGLVPNTDYNTRVVGTNSYGTNYGNNMIFITGPQTPTVVTGIADDITYTSSRLNATVNPNGSLTTCYFEHGISTIPVSYPIKTDLQSIGSGINEIVITDTINSLKNSTAYNFRLVAINTAGTVYGNNQVFITTLTPPWTQTSDPSTGADQARAMTSDNDYLYIAGYDSSPGNNEWRIEKRNTVTGTLIPDFGTEGVITNNPSTGIDQILSIIADNDYLYIAGYDSGPGNNEWRIEKRSKVTGALIPDFGINGVVTNNPSSGADQIWAIAADSDFIYIAGYDNSPGNSQSRIEKRRKDTGALADSFGTGGVVTNNPSSGSDPIYSIALDNDYIYTAGYDSASGPAVSGSSIINSQWRIEKRDKNTGALVVNGFGASGVVTSNPSITEDIAFAISADNDYLYIGGYESTPTPGRVYEWRMEKRYKTTGALVIDFSSDGVITETSGSGGSLPGVDRIWSIVSDSDYLYLTGAVGIAGSNSWRIEKLDKITGALIPDFGKNGVLSIPFSSGQAYSIVSDNYYLYIGGFDVSQWRIEKRLKTTGGQ